jgi:cation:H+ antiporter
MLYPVVFIFWRWSVALSWLAFILSSAVIVFSGTNLSRYGDVIAEKTGMGRAWIGLVLMAAVTSLPELITGISSVTFADTPDIALGDVMGSCVFNLSIIALMDILHGPKPIFSKCEQGHILSAGFGILLIGFASISILVNAQIPGLAHVGLYTPAIVIIYGIGIRSVFLFEKRRRAEFIVEAAEAARYQEITTREAVVKYSLNALVIVVAATWLPVIGDKIAAETGLGHSFVGTILIALTTSLPELVVSVAALKLGATDMAIANLLGSNMFNIFILAIDDFFYGAGPILSAVSLNHAATGFIAIIMTGIVIISLTYRMEKKMFLRFGWDAVTLLFAYILNIFLLYALRGRG